MKIYESGEMYLESIFLLKKKKANIRSIDVVNHTGYSKPSVSRAIGLLKGAGFITVSGEGYLSLTEEGLAIAEKMYERHLLLTEFFIRLGVCAEVASNDACKIEHVISEETFAALKAHSKTYLQDK